METLVNAAARSAWAGRRVLVTGHTGFKGSWLSLWLHHLGAQVTGFALPPPTRPSLFEAARVNELIHHVEGDVRDATAMCRIVEASEPEIIFHLAAQPLVRLSYREPAQTYATNVMGTVHMLDAARQVPGVKAIVCVTSDKCYENREWIWPYRENDPMGGHDPYSSSKGCAELVISAWRDSFFAGHGPLLASARAGNVIGGGDWADDRLVPDLIRALASGTAPLIRSPGSVRPWQHVLEALHGYLMLAERLFAGERPYASGWNFGPSDDDARPVSWIVERLRETWGDGDGAMRSDTAPGPHEAGLLRLDSSKARALLGWRPVLPLDVALGWISDWHKAIDAGSDARAVTIGQIVRYVEMQGWDSATRSAA